jgi:hypothetical protein
MITTVAIPFIDWIPKGKQIIYRYRNLYDFWTSWNSSCSYKPLDVAQSHNCYVISIKSTNMAAVWSLGWKHQWMEEHELLCNTRPSRNEVKIGRVKWIRCVLVAQFY